MTGSTSTLTFRDLPQDDPQQRCPDIALAKSLLNWEPKIRLEDGLRRTIDYFQKQMPNILATERES